MKDTRYKLEVNIGISKEESAGTPQNVYWQQSQERLSVSETVVLAAQDFLGVQRVLVAMHEAITNIQNYQQELPAG